MQELQTDMAKPMMSGLDRRLSRHIPLALLLQRLDTAMASPGIHGMTDLVHLVGAEWNLDERLKGSDRPPRAGWGASAASPVPHIANRSR
jgi:hypothetical protein